MDKACIQQLCNRKSIGMLFLNLETGYDIGSNKQDRKSTKQYSHWKNSIKKSISQSIKKTKKAEKILVAAIDFEVHPVNFEKRVKHAKSIINFLREAKVPIIPVRLEILEPSGNVLIRIGNSIPVLTQNNFGNEFWKYIRSKIFALGTGLHLKDFFYQDKAIRIPFQTLIEPLSQLKIEKEIGRLRFENLIATQGDYDVFVANAEEIPNLLLEIGRLRELTFRKVGEGTGKSHDLDSFDLYYLQLIIWDKKAKKIVGGYRLGKGNEIFSKLGVEGLYINSLFKIKKGLYPYLRNSIELGRSYIIEEYQKKRLPLFLLWRGILFFLLKNPEYKYLYGPLSISKVYSNISKSAIIAFVKKYYFNKKLATLLSPRKPFKYKTDKVNIELLLKDMPGQLEALDNFIEDIEPQHFRIPILLKQYVRQNAKFIGFNVDPNFSDVLDGFMILDLNDVPMSTIEALKNEKE